jgi:hypothetical protein
VLVNHDVSFMTPRPPRHLAQPSEPIGDLEMELRVPGSPHYLQTIRTVVGRAAHLMGFSFDGIEDLALAVDEAAVLLLERAPSVLWLRLEGGDSGVLEVRIGTPATLPAWPPDDLENDTRWQILSALCERTWPISGSPSGVGLAQTTR